MSVFWCKKYWFKKPCFVQLTVDVADFNKTKVKSEEVYMNATRYIVSSSLYILFPYCLILALNDSSIGFSSYWECCLVNEWLNEWLFSQYKTWNYNKKINNVAVIWLKERYVDKIPISSRPGKIIWILKESSAKSMNTVSRGIIPLCKTWALL